MSIRLAAIDLDGTLLDSRKRLSERNRNAIAACAERGIQVVPCTGRTVMGIPESVLSIPGIRYAIVVNGAGIEDLQEKKALDRQLLSRRTALEIIELVKNRRIMYDVYIEGVGISEDRFYNHLEDYNIPEEIKPLIRRTRRPEPSIEEYVRRWNGDVDKMNLYFTDLRDRESIRSQLEKRGDVLVSSSLGTNLEINGPGAAKGEALLRLASILGISREETMACGDGENDASMIRMAGIGVVMANGDPQLKAEADYITDSNDEDGVAAALEKLALSGGLH